MTTTRRRRPASGRRRAGFVLQVGERGVVAGVAEVQSDLVETGPEGVPCGPFGQVDVREARGVQERRPVDAGPGGQATIARMLGLPVGQDEPGAGAEKLARVDGGGVRIRGELEGVDGDGGVGDVAGEPGIGEVTDDEPGPADQAEQRRALGGLLDRDGREIHSDQGNVRGAGEPEARAAATAAQVDQRLSGCEVQGVSHVAEQA